MFWLSSRLRWHSERCEELIHHDAADAFALVHEVKGLVDFAKRHRVRDHRVDHDLSIHVPIDDPWHIGAPACATEGGTFPDPAGHQLERPRRDFLAGAGDADNDALAPAAMAALQRHAHQVDIADAFKGVVGAADLIRAALRHVDKVRDEIAADFLRIDEMRHAEALSPGFLVRVEIDADDHVGAGKPQALNNIETDAAEAEHDCLGARFDLGGVKHRADSGGHPAADVTDLVEGGVLADFRYRDFR